MPNRWKGDNQQNEQLTGSWLLHKLLDLRCPILHGRPMSERFPDVLARFGENLASGADVGASFCVTVEGETVVDLWGGFADEARTRPWRNDTIVGVYSTTKTMTALTALLVADRGELDFEAPVARYWPEFAAGGKDRVTVAQVMSHSAGLCGWREPITRDDLYDREKVTSLLAAQEPFWEPGTASGYHAMTQGYLVGEVVRRITGRTLGTVFREEIAAPLGADFHIGLPSSEDARVAELIPPAGPAPMGGAGGSELRVNVAGNPELDVQVTRTRAWRGAEVPAVGGIGNARAMAEISRDAGERRRGQGAAVHVRGGVPAGVAAAGGRR
jgi:CubicO group peptidase (beta-lactamase class C family)